MLVLDQSERTLDMQRNIRSVEEHKDQYRDNRAARPRLSLGAGNGPHYVHQSYADGAYQEHCPARNLGLMEAAIMDARKPQHVFARMIIWTVLGLVMPTVSKVLPV